MIRSGGFFGEFWSFLYRNRRWWVMPLIVVLLLIATLVALSGADAAPFVYRIF